MKQDTLRTRPPEAMTEAEAAVELAALAAEIAEHNRAYYELDAPTISDADYDALFRRNAAIEARFPELVREDSPSQRPGGAPTARINRRTVSEDRSSVSPRHTSPRRAVCSARSKYRLIQYAQSATRESIVQSARTQVSLLPPP